MFHHSSETISTFVHTIAMPLFPVHPDAASQLSVHIICHLQYSLTLLDQWSIEYLLLIRLVTKRCIPQQSSVISPLCVQGSMSNYAMSAVP